MARYAAVLDACVLVPVALADTLLRIAERDLYRPLWSARIAAEAIDAIVEIHPDIPPNRSSGDSPQWTTPSRTPALTDGKTWKTP
jgi:3-deoxy-D-arabino-heptulosonate 7-phosphate (DAHP) synthase